MPEPTKSQDSLHASHHNRHDVVVKTVMVTEWRNEELRHSRQRKHKTDFLLITSWTAVLSTKILQCNTVQYNTLIFQPVWKSILDGAECIPGG